VLTELAYRVRTALPWSPPAVKWPVPVRAVTDDLSLEAVERLAELAVRYDLRPWSQVCEVQDWRESLYVLDVLDQLLPGGLPPGRCLDVGSKNGAYLPGLATAVERGWDAVELDAHRRYVWGATRRAHGERMAAAFADCRFVADDVRNLPGPYALITWFLPFLTPDTHSAWGLPEQLFHPDQLFRHVVSTLAPGGVLLVVNQGALEAEVQEDLFVREDLVVDVVGRVASPLSPFRKPRYGFVYRAPRVPLRLA
jgi:SAM-dependent methyltransferase